MPSRGLKVALRILLKAHYLHSGMLKKQAKRAENKDESGCTDYRKMMIAKVIAVDDSLARNRQLSWKFMLVLFVTIGMQCGSALSLFMSTDAKLTLDYVRAVMLGGVVNIGLISQFVSRHRLARIHEFLEHAMRTPRTELPEEKKILLEGKTRAAKQMNFFTKMFLCNTVIMTWSQTVNKFLFGSTASTLPIPWCFPPTDTVSAFVLIFSYQSIATAISNCTGWIIMSFMSITIQLCATFDALTLALRNIERRAVMRSTREHSSRQTALYNCLRDDIATYTELIRELEEITPYFRNTFLTVSAGLPLILACEAYPLMLGDMAMSDKTKSVVFLAIQITCWALLCYSYEGLTDKHFEVFHAMYDTPWYESDVPYQKMVLSTLTYCTQPKYIKARLSNEVTANMATFYSFVVSAFNLLNMIRKMG